MSVYAIATIPMPLMALEKIATFPDNTVKTVAYAGDFATEEGINSLKHCCNTLCNLGPKLG